MPQAVALRLLIYGSLVVALALAVAPLPDWALSYRPLWIPLTVLYWLVTSPQKCNLGTAWVAGLLFDALRGGILGQHALAIVIVGYVTLKLHRQFPLFSVVQQTVLISLGLALYLGLAMWIESIGGNTPDLALYWRPLLTSVLLWPWLSAVLSALQRRFGHT
ncbi:MAG: rod shape-determining protein MreD [Thiotrichales bacterium]